MIAPARILALLPFALLCLSCGGDDVTGHTADFAPEVIGIAPTPSGGVVGLLQDFTLTFNKPMNPATLNASTVRVTPMTGSLHLSYDEASRTLWVAPDSLYPPDANLTLSVSAGAMTTTGDALSPFTMPFSTGPLTCASLADRLEPNDTTTAATTVPLDSLIVGLSTCMDDQDYYRVVVTEPVKVTAHTYLTQADALSWGIYWVREDGQTYSTLGTTAHAGDDKSFRFSFLPGTYWLRVFGHTQEPIALYDLRFETGPACQDDAYEDNEFPDQARSVTPGRISNLVGCYLDADWFTFSASAGQTITVTMDLGAYSGIRRLYVQEAGGQYAQESGSGGTVTVTLTATQSGPVRMYAMVWQDAVPYALEIGVSGP